MCPYLAQPKVERIDTAASESNVDLAQLVSNAATEACREANVSVAATVVIF